MEHSKAKSMEARSGRGAMEHSKAKLGESIEGIEGYYGIF